MKKYNAIFGLEDKMRESKASKEQIEKRRTQMEEYESWLLVCNKRYRSLKQRRIDMRNKIDTDESEGSVADEKIEFLLEVKETIIDEE